MCVRANIHYKDLESNRAMKAVLGVSCSRVKMGPAPGDAAFGEFKQNVGGRIAEFIKENKSMKFAGKALTGIFMRCMWDEADVDVIQKQQVVTAKWRMCLPKEMYDLCGNWFMAVQKTMWKRKSKSTDGALLLYVDFSGSDMEKRTDLENKEKGRLWQG